MILHMTLMWWISVLFLCEIIMIESDFYDRNEFHPFIIALDTYLLIRASLLAQLLAAQVHFMLE